MLYCSIVYRREFEFFASFRIRQRRRGIPYRERKTKNRAMIKGIPRPASGTRDDARKETSSG
ncbi:hypothetical protein A2Y83_03075 [Candidatus Falkowbacteria bacterium RBG_13_39_14]|uniref:Uncharacterized protein n=1 Tax=Candidatus Falkowbacteria bacterium RBG_13_39_14 TaxID=1797985 RepID=A0A1F5S546_9BACT|nr:MAG: hypothetical protein A2Y83_03075 [Candidatus Falkowbacteria bacterium RBG_13_39_14]